MNVVDEHKQAAIVLEKLNKAIERDLDLVNLTVIVMAKRDLEAGKTARDALYRIQIDLDKLRYEEAEGFGDWCRMACDCLQASDVIRQHEDFGRSKTAQRICAYLEQFDLDSARAHYGHDGDKVVQYQGMQTAIERTAIGCRLHGRLHYCSICREW
jgi:hypothetical protein